jgi:6-phosphofructo-2-kinase/fructose-2,6-biphosphatase
MQVGSMGITSSTANSGDQLHVTLKLHEVHQLPGGLSPHVYGSSPLAGAWDAGKSVPMEREDISTWSLAFVLPASHEELLFKFVLKPKGVAQPAQAEEGPERSLKEGAMDGLPTASFRLGPGKQSPSPESVPSSPRAGALLEFPVHVEAEKVSPFVLAANYKAMKERQQV